MDPLPKYFYIDFSSYVNAKQLYIKFDNNNVNNVIETNKI
jgi:hypothetical protein